MKKLFVLAVAALLLAACSSDPESASSTPPVVGPSVSASLVPSLPPAGSSPAESGDGAYPKVCSAVRSGGLPGLLGNVDDPNLLETHILWISYLGSVVTYLDDKMDSLQSIVDQADAQDRAAEKSALEAAKAMRDAAVGASALTPSNTPTSDDIDALAKVVLAYTDAAIELCPGLEENWPPGAFGTAPVLG